MPGLIRGVARTAAIAGTATAVSNGVSRRQAGRWAEKDQQQQAQAVLAAAVRAGAVRATAAAVRPATAQYAPPPRTRAPAAPTVDIVGELTKLAQLKDAGALSEAEFEAAKAKLLG